MEVKPGYKQTEVGVIPEEWEVVAAGQLGRFRGGNGFPLQWQGATSGVYPFFKVSDMNNEGNETFMTNANNRISEETRKQLGATIFPAQSIVFAKVGAAIFLERKKILLQPSCIDNNMAAFMVDARRADYRFIHTVLLSTKLGSLVATTALPSLSGKQLSEIVLRLPPLPEQRAMAAALGDLDALIGVLDQFIAKKCDLKQAAMQQLLSGKIRLPGFRGKWEIKRLRELCWYQEGPGVRHYQFTKDGIKLLNGTNIVNGKVVLDTTNRYTSKQEAFGCYKHFLVDGGDILIASSGVSIDRFHEKVAFASFENLPLCMNTSTIRFKVNPSGLLDKYLYFFLQSDLFKEQIGKQATGSAQLNFGPAHLGTINIRIPPSTEEQTAIATVLSDMDGEIAALERRRDKTRALKQGMMQELLTGKTRLI